LLCALLLVGCGFIEGYLSPDPTFPMISRVIVGFGYGIVMIGALTGHLFGRSRPNRTPEA
jgi:VIT1/CCC1 family predicted Fe2+/Mn2+ transporter